MSMEATARVSELGRPKNDDGQAHTGSITVVGIGAGGVEELGAQARTALRQATIIIGSKRQLGLLPEDFQGDRIAWPSPLVPAIPALFAEFIDKEVVVLGSGDPMFHGIGSTLHRLLPNHSMTVIPQPSSASLACARLGWALDATSVYSLVTHPIAHLTLAIEQGDRFLVLGRNHESPHEICEHLISLGQSTAEVIVLSDIGSVSETITSGAATDYPSNDSALNVIAIRPLAATRSRVPGLPDSEYVTDGQLTKQHVRALTISALAPKPHETLWDIGGGSGSIAIEWLRSTPQTTAVCFEISEERRERILSNAINLGVSDRIAVQQGAPRAFDDVPDNPDVIFIGGGLTAPGVFEAAWKRLPVGGRLVANAVTVESEQMLWALRKQFGGTISSFAISHEHTVGSFITMKPALPVHQWTVVKALTKEL
ncbi:precorrin-6Y methyltransferase [Corynebacterium diphtheriae]|uniref:precorrin-6y C5,15-methyltransferase (decarboxylating) subunit CbiE n=1 Tax=Corynebacterium diphtheriae TaxID=1717 RepID=UPI0008FB175F|nr:precorrin-6y C5,15-methyltransferase (decarboxylating) subunit CbiE [Corynebacterium diphtheriae]OIS01482.1 precorrin-6Y methyltransferase [Corynebacterium diphtheriae]